MDIRVKTIKGPIYSPRGGFELWIAWEVPHDASGYIIQHIARESEITFPGGAGPVRQSANYWEAWLVTSNGVFARKQITEGVVNDCFSHAERDANTWGTWRITGDVYFMPLDAFVESEWIKNPQTVGGAGCLFHRQTRPNPDSTTDVLLTRFHEGYWNALAGTPWYHQSARPTIWPPLPARSGDPAPPRPHRPPIVTSPAPSGGAVRRG